MIDNNTIILSHWTTFYTTPWKRVVADDSDCLSLKVKQVAITAFMIIVTFGLGLIPLAVSAIIRSCQRRHKPRRVLISKIGLDGLKQAIKMKKSSPSDFIIVLLDTDQSNSDFKRLNKHAKNLGIKTVYVDKTLTALKSIQKMEGMYKNYQIRQTISDSKLDLSKINFKPRELSFFL